MSRVTQLEKIYMKHNSRNALEFHYESLMAPPIRMLLSQYDIDQLYHIATSIKLSANIERKYEMIDQIMTSRGFKFDHRGTNRATYRFLEDPTFIAKVALDKVGLQDSPAEFRNQNYFKPFCCKIFEVDPSGVIAFVERVNPITSIEEFASVADDIFNLMVTKIIGKYVVDDLGVTKFMNYGIRMNNGNSFGPVIIDFPYVYELDGAKLICKSIDKKTNKICLGEIDYDDGLNNLICTKCGRVYAARDLKKDDSVVMKMYDDSNIFEGGHPMRAYITNADGEIVYDSGFIANKNLTVEQLSQMQLITEVPKTTKAINKTIVNKHARKSAVEISRDNYNKQQYENFKRQQQERRDSEPFNRIGKTDDPIFVTKVRNVNYKPEKDIKEEPEENNTTDVFKSVVHEDKIISNDTIHAVIPELDNPPFESDTEEASESEMDTSTESAVEDASDDYIISSSDNYDQYDNYEYEDHYNDTDGIDDDDEEDKYSEYANKLSNRDRRDISKNTKFKRNDHDDMSDF